MKKTLFFKKEKNQNKEKVFKCLKKYIIDVQKN